MNISVMPSVVATQNENKHMSIFRQNIEYKVFNCSTNPAGVFVTAVATYL